MEKDELADRLHDAFINGIHIGAWGLFVGAVMAIFAAQYFGIIQVHKLANIIIITIFR